MTQSKYQPGQKVEYVAVKESPNTTIGIIEEIVDHVEKVADRTFHPGQSQTRYKIKNLNTQKEFVHNEDQIYRVIDETSEGRLKGQVRGQDVQSTPPMTSYGENIGNFKVGQTVRYYPVGQSRIETSGKIIGFVEHDGEPRAIIKNDHTLKETHYKLNHIVGAV